MKLPNNTPKSQGIWYIPAPAEDGDTYTNLTFIDEDSYEWLSLKSEETNRLLDVGLDDWGGEVEEGYTSAENYCNSVKSKLLIPLEFLTGSIL